MKCDVCPSRHPDTVSQGPHHNNIVAHSQPPGLAERVHPRRRLEQVRHALTARDAAEAGVGWRLRDGNVVHRVLQQQRLDLFWRVKALGYAVNVGYDAAGYARARRHMEQGWVPSDGLERACLSMVCNDTLNVKALTLWRYRVQCCLLQRVHFHVFCYHCVPVVNSRPFCVLAGTQGKYGT